MAASVTVDFNANVSRFTSAVDRATNDLNKFQSHTQRVSKNINNIFSSLGVGLSVAGLVAFAKSSIDAADKLNDLSKTTNLTVTQLTGLQLAAKQTGSDLDGIALSVSKLSVNMGKDPDKFKQLGVDARDPIEALKQLSDVLIGIEDPHKRDAVAAAALGKSWQTAAPLLALGSKAIGDIVAEGQRLSPHMEEMAKQANLLNDNLDVLGTASASAASGLLNKFMPSLIDTTTRMKELIVEGNTFAAMIRGFAGIGKLPWDAYFGTDAAITSKTMIVELQDKLTTMERALETGKGGGLINKWLHGSQDDLAKNIQLTKTQIEMLEKFGAKVDAKPPVATLTGTKTDPSKFLGDDSASKAMEANRKEWEKFLDERRKGAQESMEMDFQQIQRWKDLADPAAKYRKEIDNIKYSMEQTGGVSKQVGDANIKLLEDQIEKTKGAENKMSEVWKTFADNTQRTLADVLYKGFNGTFNDIGEMFKQMLLRMAADAAAAKIMLTLFGGKDSSGGNVVGLLSGLFPKKSANGSYFDGGVSRFAMGGVVNSPTPFRFASGGSFKNGLMGEAGPEAIIPLKRDSSGRLGVSGGGGTSINYAPIINIDARTDRAEVDRIVQRAVRQGNAELVEKLQRQGAI